MGFWEGVCIGAVLATVVFVGFVRLFAKHLGNSPKF